MKRPAKFVENNGSKENIIKRAAKTFGFHTKSVLIKIIIKTPVQTVFYPPMFSDRSGKTVYICQRCNKIPLINIFDICELIVTKEELLEALNPVSPEK